MDDIAMFVFQAGARHSQTVSFSESGALRRRNRSWAHHQLCQQVRLFKFNFKLCKTQRQLLNVMTNVIV